jgi:hypothetical protein
LTAATVTATIAESVALAGMVLQGCTYAPLEVEKGTPRRKSVTKDRRHTACIGSFFLAFLYEWT